MKTVTKLIVVILIITQLNGGNFLKSGEKEHNITNSNRKNGSIKKEDNYQNSILKKIGIETKNEKIIIDTNKTKKFMKEVAKKMESEAKNITSKVKKSISGIKINKEKIVIDINKTQKFLESLAKEFEKAAKIFNKELNKSK